MQLAQTGSQSVSQPVSLWFTQKKEEEAEEWREAIHAFIQFPYQADMQITILC